jgi:hypothetical protein
VVIGMAGQLFLGGDGWGVALRLEHQETDAATLGVELSGGRGDQAYFEDRSMFRHWLVGVRGYGRYAVGDDAIALVSRAGLSLTASGLITGSLHAGAAVSYDNEHAIPVATGALAVAVPLRRGRAFAPPSISFGPPETVHRTHNVKAVWQRETPHYLVPSTELYLAFGAGVLVPVGDTGNRLSLDVSVARALRDVAGLVSLSIADAQRFND